MCVDFHLRNESRQTLFCQECSAHMVGEKQAWVDCFLTQTHGHVTAALMEKLHVIEVL